MRDALDLIGKYKFLVPVAKDGKQIASFRLKI
jgi:hypothetical protein